MRIFGRSIWSIPTVVGVAALALAGWVAFPSAQPDPLCTADPDLRVKIGSQLFVVPRVYLPHILDYEGNLVGLPKSICQRPEDPPIEAAQFFIRGFDPYIEQDAHTRAISGVQVELFSRRALADRSWPEQAFVQCSNTGSLAIPAASYSPMIFAKL